MTFQYTKTEKQNKDYTKKQEIFITNNSDLNTLKNQEIATTIEKLKKPNLSETTLLLEAQFPNNKKRWTEEETTQFKEDIQEYNYPILAQKYGRKEELLRRKAVKIFGTSLLDEIRGEFTTIWLSEVFSLHPTTIKKWIDTKKFPHKKIVISRTSEEKQFSYIIDLKKVCDWLQKQTETNPNFVFDFSKVRLKDILTVSPNFKHTWFIEHSSKKTHFGSQRPWTKEEERIVIEGYLKRRPIKIIAAQINRTATSVYKKITRLKSKNSMPIESYI